MKYTLAQYTVKEEKLREVKKAISEFVAEVRQHEPRTLYVVFRHESRATFLHLIAFEDEAAERRHSQSRYVDRFVKKLYPNCVGKPAFSDLTLFGASKKHWQLEAGG